VAKGGWFCPPSDLLLMSGLFDGQRFELSLLDALAEGLDAGAVLERLRGFGPDVLISQLASASADQDIGFLRLARRSFPGLRILVSGEYALGMPERFLKEEGWADAVLHDFASTDIPAFLAGAASRLGTISFRDGTGVVLRTGVQGKEIALAGTPRHDLLQAGLYRLPWARRFPVTATSTSFGCPFRCSFCLSGTEALRLRPVDSVLEELRRVAGLGIREVYFFDPLFTSSKRRVLELCGRMAAERLDITWSCLSRVKTFDAETLGVMRRAGCHTLQLGVESGSDEVLRWVRKGFTVADVEESVRLAVRCGVSVDGFFILGFPGETAAQMEATVRLACRLPFRLASFQLAMPLRGTAFEGNTPAPGLPFDDGERAVSLNPGFTVEDLRRVQCRANLRFYCRPSLLLRHLREVRSWGELADKAASAAKLLFPPRRAPAPDSGRGRSGRMERTCPQG